MKKISAVLFFAIALLCMLSGVSFAQETDLYVSLGAVEISPSFSYAEYTPNGSLFEEYVPDKNGYGRSLLAKADEAEAYLYAYDALEEGIRNLDTLIVVNNGSFNLSSDEVEDIVEAYSADHPEHFWLYHTVNAHVNGNVYYVYPVYSLYNEYYFHQDLKSYILQNFGFELTEDEEGFTAMIKADAELFQSRVDVLIEDMYDKVLPGENDFDTQYLYALWLHDVVCDAVYYDLTAPNHQTAYGALVDGRAVCAGYAELYQYLLHEAGIDAWSVKGVSIDPSSGEVVSHEWTLMWLDGVCVYTDTTWDDQGPEIYHVYFAEDYYDFAACHAPSSGFYANGVPICHDGCANVGYFDYFDAEDKADSLTVENVGTRLKEKKAGRVWVSVVYFEENVDISSWLNNADNLRAVISGYLSSGNYSFSAHAAGSERVGTELHLVVIKDGENKMYVEKKHIDGRYLLYALKGFASTESSTLYVVFSNDEGKTLEIQTIPFEGVFDEYDITLPKGCTHFKIVHLEDGALKPLCDFVSPSQTE